MTQRRSTVLRDAFVSTHVDTAASPPFRLLLIHEPAGDRVLLSATHVAFDGIGALRLLTSISRAYAGEDDPVAKVDLATARTVLDTGAGSGGGTGLPRQPTRLAAVHRNADPGFGVTHLDRPPVAAPAGSTVNDVLLAAGHLAAARWNEEHDAPSDHVSLMMPVNRRPAAWRNDVVANIVVSVPIASTPADRTTPDRLLAAVTVQTNAVKDGALGSTATLARTTPIPVALRRGLPRVIDAVADRTADTGVCSNLGRVDDPPWFGGTGRGVWFSPPPRVPVLITIGAATTTHGLHLSFRWCRSAFGVTDGARFAGLYIDALTALEPT